MHLPAWPVGPRLPALMQVRAGPLQLRQRLLHLPCWLSWCPLRASLPTRQLRGAVPGEMRALQEPRILLCRHRQLCVLRARLEWDPVPPALSTGYLW